jgi:hypothetical protein
VRNGSGSSCSACSLLAACAVAWPLPSLLTDASSMLQLQSGLAYNVGELSRCVKRNDSTLLAGGIISALQL